jgi:hypothetical protein
VDEALELRDAFRLAVVEILVRRRRVRQPQQLGESLELSSRIAIPIGQHMLHVRQRARRRDQVRKMLRPPALLLARLRRDLLEIVRLGDVLIDDPPAAEKAVGEHVIVRQHDVKNLHRRQHRRQRLCDLLILPVLMRKDADPPVDRRRDEKLRLQQRGDLPDRRANRVEIVRPDVDRPEPRAHQPCPF